MTLEDTLGELARRRAGFKDRALKIKEELRIRELALLAEERTQIEDLIAKAIASGATLGDVKRAYGTKDHRTITNIVAARQAEIAYWRDHFSNPANGDWFTITGDGHVIISDVLFEVTPLEHGDMMLITTEPQWNEDFTVENETVKEFDGKTQADNPRIGEIVEAISQRP